MSSNRNLYESEEECCYHPGIYVDHELFQWCQCWWSCCRFDHQQLVNRECRSDFLVEDEELTEIMKIASGENGID